MIYSAENLLNKVEEYGFLPFFKNGIPGYSAEEMCPPELWFTDKEGLGNGKVRWQKAAGAFMGNSSTGKRDLSAKSGFPTL